MTKQSLSTDNQSGHVKILPNSILAEQCVLGGLMLDNNAWNAISNKLVESDFYRKDHRLIFRTIKQLADKQIPFDVVTISEELESIGELGNAGGLFYLGTMAKDTPSASNIVTYANIIRDRAILRQLFHVGTSISDSALHPKGRDTSDILDDAERHVVKIIERRRRGREDFTPIQSLLTDAVDKVDGLYKEEGFITGASTGLSDFDTMTSGLQPSDLIIVAGRPSMGKTSLTLNIAEYVALKNTKPVAIFSMEMPRDKVAMRMMSSLGRIDQHKIKTGKLDDKERQLLIAARNSLTETNLFIDDTPALTLAEIRSKSSRLARKYGQLGLIVIDYLQLMRAVTGNSREQQISDISRGLKSMAKELNTPVIILIQLNRNLERRPNKRPILADLQEYDVIEEDADLIVFVYRDEIYNPDTPDKGIAEIIIGKQRNGPVGTVKLAFQRQYSRFGNLPPKRAVPQPVSSTGTNG